MQAPLQALSQYMPSTQWPLAQSDALVQAAPFSPSQSGSGVCWQP
jgi:hypothetical protein